MTTNGARVTDGRTARLVVVLALATALALAAAGCGAGNGSARAQAEDGRFDHARALFRQICAGCHRLADAGANGYREPLDTSVFAGSTQKHLLARTTIEIGDTIMPDWKGSLSQREIDALATYLAEVTGRRTRSGDGRRSTTLTPRPDPWVTRPPAERFADGNALFREMCAGCHTLAAAGAHGERVNLDAALAPVPDRAAVVRHALKYSDAMPDWTRRLRPSEIDALVRYVSTVAGRER